MTPSASTLLASHQLAVVASAKRWRAARGGVRAGESEADRDLVESLEMLEHVEREARAEDDTRPVRHTPPDPLRPIGGQGPWKP